MDDWTGWRGVAYWREASTSAAGGVRLRVFRNLEFRERMKKRGRREGDWDSGREWKKGECW